MADIFKSGGGKRFQASVEEKEERKQRARREQGESLWYGLGVIGVIGWSVVIPTLIGLGVGIWLDSRYGGPGEISWTLTLMLVGLALGAANAWHWISRQHQKIDEECQKRKKDGSDECE